MYQELRYHIAIFRLLGIEPNVSPWRLEALAAREAACGVAFPEAIREWYSIDGVEPLFHHKTNNDHLVDLKSLGDPEQVAQGYLRVATENQAVVAWFARLDGSDDPPVFHNDDEWDEDLSAVHWQLCTVTFTNFIYDMPSEYHFGGWDTGACLHGQVSLPDEATLRSLRETYLEGPITDQPDSRVWRFFDTRGQFKIAANSRELLSAGRAQWWIEARSLDLLPELLSSVRDVPGIGSLEPGGYTPEARAEGAKVLEEFKQRKL